MVVSMGFKACEFRFKNLSGTSGEDCKCQLCLDASARGTYIIHEVLEKSGRAGGYNIS